MGFYIKPTYFVVASRAAEEAFVNDIDESSPGTEWERVARLCDFNPKSSKQAKDVSRMRSVLISLKQAPLVHWRATLWKHYICNILILLSEALHLIGLIMLSSFGPNLLSLELLIVCDCMFLPSTVFSRADRRGRWQQGEGSLPRQPQPVLFVHYSGNKFLFQTINMKPHYWSQDVLQFGVRFKGMRNFVISRAEAAQSLGLQPCFQPN